MLRSSSYEAPRLAADDPFAAAASALVRRAARKELSVGCLETAAGRAPKRAPGDLEAATGGRARELGHSTLAVGGQCRGSRLQIDAAGAGGGEAKRARELGRKAIVVAKAGSSAAAARGALGRRPGDLAAATAPRLGVGHR